jgi:hypothetical protein
VTILGTNFFLKQKGEKYYLKLGFIDNVVFYKCQNSKEDILFLKFLISKFFGRKR